MYETFVVCGTSRSLLTWVLLISIQKLNHESAIGYSRLFVGLGVACAFIWGNIGRSAILLREKSKRWYLFHFALNGLFPKLSS